MKFDALYSEHKEIMKKHNEHFNNLKNQNKIRHEEINESISQKYNRFAEIKRKNSDDFRLIRNKRL